MGKQQGPARVTRFTGEYKSLPLHVSATTGHHLKAQPTLRLQKSTLHMCLKVTNHKEISTSIKNQY
jgi:hypothetical protein